MSDTAIKQAAAQIEAVRNGNRAGVRTFFDEATFTATHVVYDPASRRAVIVDPVLDFDQASGRTANRHRAGAACDSGGDSPVLPQP